MKRTFDLGMSVVPIQGRHRRLSLTVEFGGQTYRTPEEGFFALEGTIGGKKRWVECGQCQKHIRQVCKKKWHQLLDELLEFDNKYYLRFCKKIPEKDAKRIKEIIEKGA